MEGFTTQQAWSQKQCCCWEYFHWESSLLNNFFNFNLEVGIDQTTLEATPIKKGKVTIWDSPGINEDFDLHDITILKLFGSANKIFILYNTSLKSCKNEVRILNTLKPSATYFIRTQCDRYKNDEELKKSLDTDEKILKSWGIQAKVYATSAHKNLKFLDNQTVKQLMDN